VEHISLYRHEWPIQRVYPVDRLIGHSPVKTTAYNAPGQFLKVARVIHIIKITQIYVSKNQMGTRNIKRHWKLFGLLVILALISYRLFTQNYRVRLPYESVHQASYNDLLGSLAGCESAANIAANDSRMAAEIRTFLSSVYS